MSGILAEVRTATLYDAAGEPETDLPSASWSAGIINFNGAVLVCDTIASLKAMALPPGETVIGRPIVDQQNLARVACEHPDVRIVSMGCNTGRPNLARNRALALARHRYVLLTDNDVLFAPDAGSHLMEAICRLPNAAVCTPLVVYRNDGATVLTESHPLHFLCWSTRCNRTISEARERGVHRGVGCGIQMIDKVRTMKVGFLDGGMALGWGDDGEFHYRVEIAGLGCYAIPEAIVFHPMRRAQHRIYGQVHNRWRMLLKDYQWRTLVAAAPALVVYELLLAASLIAMGAGRDYRRALADVAGSLPEIMRQRRLVRAVRKVSDDQILYANMLAAPGRLEEQLAVRIGLDALSVGFRLYWSLASRLLHLVPQRLKHAR